MKILKYPLLVMMLLLLYGNAARAQLFPGMRVNGKIVAQGDTVYVCQGSSLTYQNTSSGFNTVTWHFSGGTPATSTSTSTETVTYNSAGIDTTKLVAASNADADSMYIFVRVSNEKPVVNWNFTPDNVCGNIPISFTNTSTGTGNHYTWDFADGATTTALNPSHQFLNAIGSSGTQVYNVKLRATNFYGCSDSVIKPVTIIRVPDASIGNADPGVTFIPGTSTFKVCTNTPAYLFQFQNLSTTIPTNVTYTIKWGDASVDSVFTSWPAGNIIQHTYTIGAKELVIEVTGPNGCIGIKKYTVFLGTNPAGGFNSLGNTNVCAPDSLEFVISGYQNNAPGTTYTVTINDGSAPLFFTHPPPDTVIHTFLYSSCNTTSSNGTLTFPNSYNATLTIENPCDLTSVSVIPIYVSGKPRPSIRVLPSTTVCTESVTYIVSTSSYGGIVTPTGGGNSTCDNVGKQVWKIEPSTGYDLVGGSYGSLNNNPLNGFVWTNGETGLNVVFHTTGTYTVTIYVFNERCGIDSTKQDICVRNPPMADFTVNSHTVCESGTAVFTNTSPLGLCLGESYEWRVQYLDPLGCGNAGTNYSFINGTSSTSANAEIQFAVPGKYAVTLTTAAVGTNGSCAPATKTDTFTVKGRPKVAIDPPGSICVGTAASPTATVSGCYGENALQYAWTFTNGNPSSSTSAIPGTVLYNQTGTFPIQLTATNECGNTSELASIEVIAPPVAFAGNDTTVCQDTDSLVLVGEPFGGNWSNAALITPTGGFTPSTPGTYTLIYTYGNGTCADTDTLTVIVKDSITNNIIAPDQSICINTQPAIINGQVATGGDGTPAYQWQQSTDSLNWTDIAGATGLDYTPPVLIVTTFYRRIAFTTLCAGTQGSFSVPVKITVHENSIADFSASQTVSCIPFDLNTVINVVTYPGRNGQYAWFADNVSIGSNATGVFPGYSMNVPDDTVIIKLVTSSQFGCLPDERSVQFITTAASIARFTKDVTGGCGPVDVNFNNISSTINNNIQFFWDFGDGSGSTLAQPGIHTFNSSPFFNDTTYIITLKAYNGCDTTNWIDSVRIKSKPKSRFGVQSTFGCSPFTVVISNNSPGSNSTYYWDFGNGHLDTTFAPGTLSYTYNTGPVIDTFTIQMIAVNECGVDTQRLDIRIAPNVINPVININGSELFGCAPHIVDFINSSSGATSYVWDFGDGSAPVFTNNNQVLVTHTYLDSGTYNVKIDITNGCSDTAVFRQITVYRQPNADFTTSALTYCQGDTVRVNNLSTDANSYVWNWGDGQSSSGDNPTHVYQTGGNFTVYLRAERTNSSGVVCYDTAVQFITVLVKPDVAVQTNIAVPNCAPFTFTASAPGIINETSNWFITDTTVSPSLVIINGPSVQYTFNKPGTFTVKFVAQNDLGCTDSTTVNFVVRGTPVASFAPGDLVTCTLDTTVSYLNTTIFNDNGPLTYRWIVDNLQLATSGNFTHRYTLPAGAILPRIFTTQLIARNTVGCADTAVAVLNMNPSATAQFTLDNPAACVPYAANITNTSTYTTNYKWFVNGLLTDTTANPVLLIDQPQTAYTIRLIAGNIYGCKPDTFETAFTSRIKPDADFDVSDSLGCSGILNVATANHTRSASSYVWDWGDNSSTSSLTNPTHLYNTEGQYLISLVASDGVCRDTALQLVRVSVKPTANFNVSDTLTCDTARVQFINLSNGASNFLWSYSDGGSSTDVNPIHSFAPSLTPYSVKLVADNGLGCKDSLTKANLVVAKVPPAADFYISPSAVITVPNYTFSFNNLTPNSNRFFYQWNLGDGTFDSTYNILNHKYTDTGNYAVQLIVFDTSTNCADTVIRIARIDGFPGYLYVPNAICPGCLQTGLRDFLPKGKGLAQYRLQIFTTWNELVFQTTSLDADGAPNQPWDGRYKGQIVQQDVYVWRIDAKFQNGTEWIGMIYPGEGQYKKVGTITVVK